MQANNKHPTSPEDYITGTSNIMDVTCASRQQASNIPRRLHHWHIRHHGCYVCKQTTSTQHPPKTTSLAHWTAWMLRVQADNKHPTSPEDYITGTSDIMDVKCASRQQAPNIPRRLHHWHIRHHGCYVCKQATSTQHPPKTTSLAHPTSWMLCVQANNKHPTFPEDYITGTSDIMDVTQGSYRFSRIKFKDFSRTFPGLLKSFSSTWLLLSRRSQCLYLSFCNQFSLKMHFPLVI